MKYRNAFYFDGKSSMDFGLYISGDQTFNGPERNVSKVSIPGRSGDLIISDGSFKNYDYPYKCFLAFDLDHKARELRSWLLSKDGYCRLEDDYHPEEFKMAAFKGPIDFDVHLLTAGEATLTFDCKPQRYLKTGETRIEMKSSDTQINIVNPTYFPSRPIIRIGGEGSAKITIVDEAGNRQEITVSEVHTTTDDIVINSEIEQTYLESTYTFYNNYLTLSTLSYPTLAPGKNTVTKEGNVYINIIPRWFML